MTTQNEKAENLHQPLKFDPKIFHLSVIHSETKKSIFPPSLESSKKSVDSSSSPYLFTLLQIASISFHVPFKITWNSSTASYQILPGSRLRKVICFGAHLHNILMYSIFNFQMIFLDKEINDLSSTLSNTFDNVSGFGTLVMNILFIQTYWTKQEKILSILEASRVTYSERSGRFHRLVAILLVLYAYVSAIFVFIFYQTKTISELDLTVFKTEDGNLFQLLSFPGIVQNLVYYHSATFSYSGYLTIVFIAVATKGVTSDFRPKLLQTLTTGDVKRGLESYMGLKKLCSDITGTFGGQILTYYIISVVYFAKIPESQMWTRLGERTAMIVYFSMGFVMWLLAAEFHMKVREVVQSWATQMQNREQPPTDTRIRLMSVVNDNLLDPIGISCKFFTISYGFLGSMLGLIVTYAIIVFQMQAKPQSLEIANFVNGSNFNLISSNRNDEF